MPSYKSIIETLDRSQSLALVQKIELTASLDVNELDQICDALEKLGDARVERPLLNLASNKSLDTKVRLNAIQALSHVDTTTSSRQRQEWWHSDDQVLKSLAIAIADGTEFDLLKTIVSDPQHKQYVQALNAVRYCENASIQNDFITALDTKSIEGQIVAARALMRFEPYRAEAGLLKHAQSQNRRLAHACLDTLAWYTSTNVLTELNQLAKTGPQAYKERYQQVLAYLSEEISDFSEGHSDRQQEYLNHWLQPIKTILADQRPKLQTLQNISRDSVDEGLQTLIADDYQYMPFDELLLALKDPNGHWEFKLLALHAFKAIDYSGDRKAAAEALTEHTDAEVRAIGAHFLHDWDMKEALIALLADSSQQVANAAALHLARQSKDSALAPDLLKLFEKQTRMSTTSVPALSAFFHHTEETDANDHLIDLVQNDDRETVIECCLNDLKLRKQTSILSSMRWLIEREPLVTWSIHGSFIDKCHSLGISDLKVDHLQNVDDLHLQISLAKYLFGAEV